LDSNISPKKFFVRAHKYPELEFPLEDEPFVTVWKGYSRESSKKLPPGCRGSEWDVGLVITWWSVDPGATVKLL